jgi:hypothetical protein
LHILAQSRNTGALFGRFLPAIRKQSGHLTGIVPKECKMHLST